MTDTADIKNEWNPFDDEGGKENTKDLLKFVDTESTLTPEERLSELAGIVYRYGQIDGGHHKMWVMDQMIRRITGKNYEDFVKDYQGEYNEEEEYFDYEWDEGIAP